MVISKDQSELFKQLIEEKISTIETWLSLYDYSDKEELQQLTNELAQLKFTLKHLNNTINLTLIKYE